MINFRNHRLVSFALLTVLVGLTASASSARAAPSESDPPQAFGWDPCLAALAAFVGAVEQSSSALGAREAEVEPSVAATGSYQLVSVPSDQVDGQMIIGDEQSGLPEMLQGLWWLDGNPLPDEVVSFGGSTWDPVHRTTRIQVYGEGVWSWHDSLAGRALYAFVRRIELVYELQFNEQLDQVVIVPIVRVGNTHVRVPEQVVKFTSTRLTDGAWLRENYVGGVLVEVYVFRRIVRGDGEREPAFVDYVRAAPRRALLAEQTE